MMGQLWIVDSKYVQVGACIVDEHNKIVGIGYNGMPTGCDDDVLPWSKCGDDPLNTKYPYGRAVRV
jgi:dCMP deaminase